ncbi:MAG TPA: acyl-CoA dehydrogenase family protein [Candidatus Limnocylindrales bacterium]|nr:acyl-CoA dehydrogenase family protein [Candidatus Limnocylindrales bacterium]
MSENVGRQLLQGWLRSKPDNYYTCNANLDRLLALFAGAGEADAMRSRLRDFGGVLASKVDPLVVDCERVENLPRLRGWSGIGELTEEVEFHPSYREAGRHIWRSGIMAIQAKPGRNLEQAAMIYLLAHMGEGGHACPVACTSGLIKALQVHGTPALQERFLTRLLDPDYDRAHMGSQFMTEVQGGSDVGANVVEATPDPEREGMWRVRGEKWFCSVANADQFFITARVAGGRPGTAGLGAFLVPRRTDDGAINGFRIRRLKNKLGTRAMASGEIDFQGALAYPIGRLEDGFKIAAGLVLNTSRWVNALGSTGVMRRAYIEAVTYAAARKAFGNPIGRYPMVRETLAAMKCEEQAALSSTLFLTTLIDKVETSTADQHELSLYRFLVNANKYITSIAASDVAHAALEVLGGNGAIEDFSPVPRLLRDNFVFESWEGTHNVLCMQVLKDSAKLALLPNVYDEITTVLESLENAELRAEVPPLVETLSDLGGRMTRSLTVPEYGATHFRRQLTEMSRLFQASRLLWEADREIALGNGSSKTAVAQLFIRRHLLPAYRPDADPAWNSRIDAVLAEDLKLEH